MPANRSRTERWLDCMHQLYERGGGIEFSLAGKRDASGGQPTEDSGSDVVWRVKILKLTDDEIWVERPAAFGHALPMEQGIDVIGVMSIGQNRWMFHSRTLGMDTRYPGGAVRLVMPKTVERCRRREFYRMSTAALTLPRVTCWPLLDPMSVVVAEVANKAAILEMQMGRKGAVGSEVLPDVGPSFNATLMNLGGGGVGLLVGKDEAGRVDSSRLLWMRLDLRPQIISPIGVTARIAHVHRDSEQNLYIGGAFDFSFHQGHKDFVVAQMTRYVQQLLGERRAVA
jgi:hypothetical protein